VEAYIAESMEEAEDIRASDEVGTGMAVGTDVVHQHDGVWRAIAAGEGG
jgi:hypothetical protein